MRQRCQAPGQLDALPWRICPEQPTARIGDSALANRLRGELEGEVLFDAFSRGRYSTDASIYQIEPIGVVVPMDAAGHAREEIREAFGEEGTS